MTEGGIPGYKAAGRGTTAGAILEKLLKHAAFAKTMECGDRVIIGILYREKKEPFHRMNKS